MSRRKKKTPGTLQQRTLFQQSWLQFRHNRTAMLGLGILLVLSLIVATTIVVDLLTDQSIYRNYVDKQVLINKLALPWLFATTR